MELFIYYLGAVTLATGIATATLALTWFIERGTKH